MTGLDVVCDGLALGESPACMRHRVAHRTGVGGGGGGSRFPWEKRFERVTCKVQRY